MTRSVLIVSPYFPPSQLAGVHRARHLATHLPAAGWTPIVICVHEACHEQRIDPALAALVPPSTEIIKVSALPASATRMLGLGDIALRAWPAMRRAVLEVLSTRRIDAVLLTAAPYYQLLLAPEIRRRFGVPVVLDFQDPWVSRWGAQQAKWGKAGLAHQLATWLEPVALRSAAFVTSVSEMQNDEMAARHPWLDREKMAALPIGGDPNDFTRMPKGIRPGGLELGDTGKVELSYVGSYWPAVEPTLRAFLRGAARLQRETPGVAEKIRLNFVGTDATASGANAKVQAIAAEEGVAHLVREEARRLPYLDALAVTARSDGLLLIGSDEPHYTASKIYTALMSGRPYLSLFHERSSAHDVLVKAGGGIALCFGAARDLQRLEGKIAAGLRRLAEAPASLGKADRQSYAALEARAIAGGFAAILDRVTAGAPSHARASATAYAKDVTQAR